MTYSSDPSPEELKQRLERTQRDFSILYEISNAMRTTLELNHILYIILTGVTSHAGLGFNRAILFLADPEEKQLEPKMAIGPKSGEHAQEIWSHIASSNQHLEDLIKKDKLAQNTDQSALYKSIKDLKIPLTHDEQNVLSDAFYSGQAMILHDNDIKQLSNDIFLGSFKTNELVVVPLKAKDKVIGLIVADNIYTQKQATDDDLRMFITLSNQAALAIENSRLYEMVRHRSHTDPVTELWNHGFFQYKLSSLIDESRQSKNPLTLIIIDIDNFKTLNDTYGHQNGDAILKQMAGVLRESSREGDFVCRYGGEEFSIILPATNKDQARTIAERMRQNIEAYAFKGDSDQPLQCTVSIGLAAFADDADNKEKLIETADRAMYAAKKNGKNQISVA